MVLGEERLSKRVRVMAADVFDRTYHQPYMSPGFRKADTEQRISIHAVDNPDQAPLGHGPLDPVAGEYSPSWIVMR